MRTVIYKRNDKFTQYPSFRRFGELPTELRNLIWVFSLPKARIVALREYRQSTARPALRTDRITLLTHQFQRSDNQINEEENVIVYRSKSCAPSMYAVCHESRAIFQQFYTKLFQTEKSWGIWMNLKSDTLYLPLELCLLGSNFYATFQEDIKLVKNLGVSGPFYSDSDGDRIYSLESLNQIRCIISSFGNLKWLVLVDAWHRPDDTSCLNMVLGEWAYECEELLREEIVLKNDDTFLWPYFMVGVFIDVDYFGRWQTMLRKVDVWKDVLKSVSPTHWRLSRFYHRRTN